MALSASRVVMVGETPYAHEREAIELAKQALPDTDPYTLWALLDLHDPTTGRLHEIDLLILGYSALYLVEVKSGPGRYEGDTVDWYRTPPGEPSRYMDPPLRLANYKAQVLKTRLRQTMQDPRNAPWIQALVFLSHQDIELKFRNYGDQCVVTRSTFRDAIVNHRFPGRAADWNAQRINLPVTRDVAQALSKLGIRERKGKAHVGSFELGGVLEEGTGFQDRLATHREMRTVSARARIYLVPQQTSVERRQQLRRAADREFQLLHELREHSNILRVTDYVDAPVGPTVLFDDFAGGIPLDAFLRSNPSLGYGERVELVAQIARAVSFCHQKRITHGALSPQAVLVRRKDEGGPVEARVFNFQLGGSDRVEATTHWSALAADPWVLYQAPELREDPTRRGPQSDLFSLGALAYLVFTGKPPAESFLELDERLRRDGHLDPRAASNEVSDEVADLVTFATARSPISRADDVREWLLLLLDAVTEPDTSGKEKPEVDPLEAGKGDVLGTNFLVLEPLGEGATSRVLLVDKDDRRYALKVPLGPEQHARFEAEANVLKLFEHAPAPVVRLVQEPELGGRKCLLLTLAGEQTLHRYLLRQGTVSLDYASRYGEDLLRALDYLEEQGVIHRDIKPANLGVGTATKGRHHLTLFDFSLAAAPLSELGVGTAAYRDPFLTQRGRWDHAADRWSAAVTLHELLTGVRPRFVTESGADALASDPGARIVIAAERFDASVRDRLMRFFERAFAPEAEQRFTNADDMRRRWEACFAEAVPDSVRPPLLPPDKTPDVPEPEPEPAPPAVTDGMLDAITPETPIGALPLSNRARNALDRAGLAYARDLLTLPDNRLSAVRGVGSIVAREILSLRERWQKRQSVTATESAAFFPSYRGDDILVATAGLPAETAAVLSDAGLHTLGAAARAPAAQLEQLATKFGVDLAALSALLERENRHANARERPTTLEGWLDALLPKQKKRREVLELLYGLAAPFEGRLDVTVREVATHQGVTGAAIYIALGKMRTDWEKHGALPELRQMVRSILGGASGALPLSRGADALTELLPKDESAPAELTRARAGGLLRIVADVEREDPVGLRLVRIREQPWLVASDAHTDLVRALGDAADELAARAVLASAGEAARVLEALVAGSVLESLPAERLLELATLASQTAARSTRLEIYPRNMSPERALDLSSPVLTGQLSEQLVRERVRARYPEAAPLPGRPELDALLERHGLRWNPDDAVYERAGARHATTLQTNFSSRGHTALPMPAREVDASVVAERDFSERLRHAVEQGALRVLGVTVDKAHGSALALSRFLGVAPVSFDRELIREMKRLGVRGDLIHQADREGAGGKAWRNLLKLSEKAAEQVAASLLPPKSPLLLIQPGPIARYRLTGFLERVAAAAKQDDSAAIFLLVPSHDTGGIPRINSELLIPGILPSQVLWMSRSWLSHHAPEAA